MLERNMYILLSAMLAFAFACVLPGGEIEEFTGEGAITDAEVQELDDEVVLKDLGEESFSAEAIRLHTSEHIHFGGTFLEEDHYRTVGGVCAPGFARVSPPTVTHAGHGYCRFKEWVNPFDTNDCRARIHLHHSAGWLYGDCYIDIFETPSCTGRCGGQHSSGCWCDSYCRTADDCCADYDPVCATPELYQTGLSASTGTWRDYIVTVPAGRSVLQAILTGGSGNADLYMRYGALPTTSAYDCRSTSTDNEETCTKPSPAAGTWYVSVYRSSNYSGVTLTGDHDKY
jgi:hypothetical protein